MNEKILLVGCGKRQVVKLSEKVVAFDIAKARVIESKKKRPDNLYFVADVTKLPFKDYIFDKIICTEVLEHVSTPIIALKEMNRVLNKHGYVILTVPTKETENLLSKISPVYKRDVIANFHKNLFKEEDLIKQLVETDFDYLTIKYINIFEFWYAFLLSTFITCLRLKIDKIHINEVGELKVDEVYFLMKLILILKAISFVFACMLSALSLPIKKFKIARYVSKSMMIIAVKNE